MRVGDVSSIGGYAFRFADLQEIKGPNYVAARGTFDVTYDGATVSTMVAEKRMYIVQKMPMTELVRPSSYKLSALGCVSKS